MIDYKTKDDLDVFRHGRRATPPPSKKGLATALLAFVFLVLSWLFLLFIAAVATNAHGEEVKESKLWVTPGAISYHFNRDRGYNERNLGFGIEYSLNKDWSILAGQYQNSIDRPSKYALVGYTPWHLNKYFSVGALAGAVTGYHTNKSAMFAVLPLVAVNFRHVGVNISFIPPIARKTGGAVGVQFKFRF